MNTNKNDILKYAGAVAAVGGTMLLGGSIIKSNRSVKKKIRKTASKAFDTLDGIMTNVQKMM